MGNCSSISSYGATQDGNRLARVYAPPFNSRADFMPANLSASMPAPVLSQANKQGRVPMHNRNPALLLTKVGSGPAYVAHLSFITQIPVGLRGGGGAAFE